MNQTALITGASSGIGYELAKLFAKDKYDLIIVARNEKNLELTKTELTKMYGVEVTAIVKDLSHINSGFELYREIQAMNKTVDVLVNNAGFGNFGPYVESSFDKEDAMMQVNMVALAQLTKFFLKDMVTRNSGKIMNVASVAGFLSGPYMAVYYATKAFVLSFSMAISKEVEKTGVTVTTLCPGTTETAFFKEDTLQKSTIAKMHKWPASRVAEMGYDGLMKGKRIVVATSFTNRLALELGTRLLPRSILMNVTKKINKG